MIHRRPTLVWSREALQDFMRGVSLPAVMIVLLWIGLWGFWPASNVALRDPNTAPVPLDVSFRQRDIRSAFQHHVLPTLFALPSEVGFSAPISPPLRPLTGSPVTERDLAMPLDGVRVPDSAFAGTRAASGFPSLADVSYRPVVDHRSVLSPVEERRWRVLVQVLDGLEHGTFSMPDLPEAWFQGLTVPVVLIAAIRFDALGFPQRIVLEQSTDRSTVNQSVIHHLYRGRLLNPKGAAWGRVLINWGFE
ncbi:MAG: hypothetical protein A2498_09575 [Lentisphaerae bacterium RIFOXYC12_FULL_60_16]|nr:MAG: hypothetical protein A2498_09575 [Lentisphaerae bacterium RIFOXYC12_FULL_60_16]